MEDKNTNVTLKEMANAVRMLAVDTLVRSQDGHPGTPTGAADIATTLFNNHLKFDPQDPRWPDRDRFVQSNGHGSTLIYSLLHLAGYEAFPVEQLKDFRVLDSNTPGHPEYEPDHGIEVTTGPLGQGIANAVGMAVAETMLNEMFGDEIVDHYTYALVGDGCLMEGLGHEAISLAGHLKLSKLIWLYDDNAMSDDGTTDQTISEDYSTRFACAGWHVVECDGHDHEAISAAISAAKLDPRPSMLRCRTLIGFGVPRIQNDRAAHGGKLSVEDAAQARERLNWPYEPFATPEPIVREWRKGGEKGALAHRAWQERVEAMDPDKRTEFDRLMEGRLPEGWEEKVLEYKKMRIEDRLEQAGIRTSGQISSALSQVIPEFVGGAPDLEAATQHKQTLQPYTAKDPGGRYIHYGVREHVMGSMINGMLSHGGIVPFGVTFLVFSDYMRHAIRLSAMMSLPAIWVFSHDSIGIGTNGPTHQPVECIPSLRAIPNMWTMRPCDPAEAAECWQLAVANRDHPSVIINSRQPLKVLRREYAGENLCAKGAYILADAEGGPRQATIFATGSEVAVAIQAREILQDKGVATAVISVPCWELFWKQDHAYRDMIIGRGTARVSVEAATKLGWERFVGEDGGIVGMESFGASGAVGAVFEKFGITAANVVRKVELQL
jgi:transketolase